MRVDTVLEHIEDLDFAYEPPCEHSQHEVRAQHGGPAYYFIAVHPPCGCIGASGAIYICKPGFDNSPKIRCATCDARFERHEVWTILSIVGK